MSSENPPDLTQLKFTGGYPDDVDLAPSVIFLVAYALTIPHFVWRVLRHRSCLLVPPGCILVGRLITLTMRAVMAKRPYGEPAMIAQLVFLSIGYILLIDPLIQMWNRNVATVVTAAQQPRWVYRTGWVLDLSLYGSFALSIASAIMMSGALDSPDKLRLVQRLVKASAAMIFAILLIVILATIGTHITLRLDTRRSAIIIVLSLPLLVVATYRLVTTFGSSSNSSAYSRTGFYVLQILFELIAYAGFLCISLPKWFPKVAKEGASEDDKSEGNVELGGRGASSRSSDRGV